MTADATIAELIALNQRLLRSIVKADWATYESLCDASITCFEPESRSHLVSGMDFHRFYFDRGGIEGPFNVTMSAPQVRLMGDVAVIAYTRLVQHADEAGKLVTSRSEETRVWEKQAGGWRHVHFHRSLSS